MFQINKGNKEDYYAILNNIVGKMDYFEDFFPDEFISVKFVIDIEQLEKIKNLYKETDLSGYIENLLDVYSELKQSEKLNINEIKILLSSRDNIELLAMVKSNNMKDISDKIRNLYYTKKRDSLKNAIDKNYNLYLMEDNYKRQAILKKNIEKVKIYLDVVDEELNTKY